MARSHFHRQLEAALLEVIDTRSKQMATGVCVDYPHYKREAGVIEGIQLALNLANELEKESD